MTDFCILCANGNDLPEGEYCRGCGREGRAVGLGAAVIKARGRQEPPKVPVAFDGAASRDGVLLERALGILHRMATENTGWRAVWSRWYYSDEPLRNDAANLVREAGFGMMQPNNTRLVGDVAVTAAEQAT